MFLSGEICNAGGPNGGRVSGSNVVRVVAEVSSGHSSGEGRSAIHAKDQRNRTGQRLAVLGNHAACVMREVRTGV